MKYVLCVLALITSLTSVCSVKVSHVTDSVALLPLVVALLA